MIDIDEIVTRRLEKDRFDERILEGSKIAPMTKSQD